MHIIKHTFQTLVIAFFAVPVSAYADSWSCSHDNNVREVHIERPTSAPVPCNVVYKKQTEGVENQILWNAENDDAYCEEKAKDFVAKLESWGWVCAETIRDDASSSGDEEETVTGDDAGKSAVEGEPATGGDTGISDDEGEPATGGDTGISDDEGEADTGAER